MARDRRHEGLSQESLQKILVGMLPRPEIRIPELKQGQICQIKRLSELVTIRRQEHSLNAEENTTFEFLQD
jgi:hypothetical protein